MYATRNKIEFLFNNRGGEDSLVLFKHGTWKLYNAETGGVEDTHCRTLWEITEDHYFGEIVWEK